MFVDLIILSIASALISFVFSLLAGILLLPFNFLSFKRINEQAEFGIPYEGKWYDLLMIVLSFLVMTYLISGISASMLSWVLERHQESKFMQVFASLGGAVVAFSFARKAGLVGRQDDINQTKTFPGIIGSMFVNYPVLIISVLLAIYPSYTKFWFWMPYVK